MDTKQPILVRVKVCADLLGLSPNMVRNLIRSGELEGFKIHSGVSHVSMKSVNNWLKSRRVAA